MSIFCLALNKQTEIHSSNRIPSGILHKSNPPNIVSQIKSEFSEEIEFEQRFIPEINWVDFTETLKTHRTTVVYTNQITHNKTIMQEAKNSLCILC